jgi:hypothetical protein
MAYFDKITPRILKIGRLRDLQIMTDNFNFTNISAKKR